MKSCPLNLAVPDGAGPIIVGHGLRPDMRQIVQKHVHRSLRHDNKISRQSNFHFQNFIVMTLPMKNSVLDNFPPCLPAQPPRKSANFILLSSRFQKHVKVRPSGISLQTAHKCQENASKSWTSGGVAKGTSVSWVAKVQGDMNAVKGAVAKLQEKKLGTKIRVFRVCFRAPFLPPSFLHPSSLFPLQALSPLLPLFPSSPPRAVAKLQEKKLRLSAGKLVVAKLQGDSQHPRF